MYLLQDLSYICISILINNTPCASINNFVQKVVYAKSTNVTKSYRFAFYHWSRNYGNRASGQSISRNNSIKSVLLASEKSKALFVARFIAGCFLPFLLFFGLPFSTSRNSRPVYRVLVSTVTHWFYGVC